MHMARRVSLVWFVYHATLEFRTMISGVLSTRFTELLALLEDVGSHSVSAGNNAAENTRITSILPDMILVVGACHAILFWSPHFARLVAVIPNLCGMHGSCCCGSPVFPTPGKPNWPPRASDVALFLCAGLHPCSFFLCRVFMCCFTGHHTSFFG